MKIFLSLNKIVKKVTLSCVNYKTLLLYFTSLLKPFILLKRYMHIWKTDYYEQNGSKSQKILKKIIIEFILFFFNI